MNREQSSPNSRPRRDAKSTRRTVPLRAFTLIELLMATVCLAAASLGALEALRYSNDKSALTRQRSAVMHYACSQMEMMKSESFNGTLASRIASNTIVIPGMSVPATLSTTVSQIPDTTLFNVNVTVRWSFEESGDDHPQVFSLDGTL